MYNVNQSLRDKVFCRYALTGLFIFRSLYIGFTIIINRDSLHRCFKKKNTHGKTQNIQTDIKYISI